MRVAAMVAVFAGAITFRGTVVLNTPVAQLSPDGEEYWHLADNLRENGTYGFRENWRSTPALARSGWRSLYDESGMVRPPGHPFVLASLKGICKENLRAYEAVFIVVEAIATLGIYGIATYLFGPVAGLAAAAFAIFDPGVLSYLTKFGREPFISLFLVAGIYCAMRAGRNESWSLSIAGGLCFGIGAYFKETLALVGIIVALWMVGIALWRRGRVWNSAILVLALFCVVTPWIIRNGRAYHRYAGFSSIAGWNLYHGLVDPKWGDSNVGGRPEDSDPLAAADGVEADRRLRAKAMRFAKEEPVAVVRAMARNMAYFWSPVPSEEFRTGALSNRAFAALAYYICLYGLGIVGMWHFRRREEILLFAIVILGMTAMHSLSLGWPRYRVPFDFLLGVLAAGYLTRLCAPRGSSAWLPSKPIAMNEVAESRLPGAGVPLRYARKKR